MKPRPTLYELLGVPQSASVAELQAGFRHEVGELEAQRAGMAAQEFGDRMQLLKVALSTLTDPVSRHGYDARLAASGQTQRPASAAALARGIVPVPDAAVGNDIRAEALSLRADALALRADALMARAGMDPNALVPATRGNGLLAVFASGTFSLMQRALGGLIMLMLVGMIAFAITRCSVADNGARRESIEAKAREQAALQEYFQTYGVRPANMAELELLEAQRRKSENEARQAEREVKQQQYSEKQFERESRQRAEEVSSRLQYEEQQARWQAEQDRQRELQQQAVRQYNQRARDEAEEMRVEREKQMWRETLRR